MQDLQEAWGEAVEAARLERGLTRQELADLCDVNVATIYRIIKGQMNPRDELKWKIAGALNVRMDRLWAWPAIVPPHPARNMNGAR